MADWYIDYVNGNDANAGTSSGAPKKLIQAAVNLATRRDVFHLADTGAHVLAATLNFTTGFTNTGNGFVKFVPYYVDGTITIQRPDEAAARVAARINTNSAASPNGSTNTYQYWQDIDFTGSSNRSVYLTEGTIINGCRFSDGLVPVGVSANGGSVINCLFTSITTSYAVVDVSAATGVTVINNFFDNCSANIADLDLGSYYQQVSGNIFVQNFGKISINVSAGFCKIFNNTFVCDGDASAKGIHCKNTSYPSSIFNNVFYNFDGASSKPIEADANVEILTYGKNAYFDCNANASFADIANDLTGDDISTTGDPFTNLAGDDYTLTASYRGTALANPNSTLDVGSVQSTSTGGGATTRGAAWVG